MCPASKCDRFSLVLGEFHKSSETKENDFCCQINKRLNHMVLKDSHPSLFSLFFQPGFPRLLEKAGIYFGFLNPGNNLEFCVKTLKFVKDKK